MSKSVLFVINGFGMGNAVRCDSLIDIIHNGYNIDVITSNEAHLYFQNNIKIRNLFSQVNNSRNENLKFGSLNFYFRHSQTFIKRIINNYSTQKKIIATGSYEAVFFDSDYSFTLHRLFSRKINIVGINNSFEVVSYLFKNITELKPKLFLSFIIEILDSLTYLLFCDFILCPTISDQPKQKYFFSKILCAPVLIRKSLLSNILPNDNEVLTMSTCSNVDSPLKLLKSNATKNRIFSLIDKFEKDNTSLITRASMIVCNAGQSSLAECLYLNKKSLVIAVPKHAEQYVNSQIAKKAGLNIAVGHENAEDLKKIIFEIFNDKKNINYNYNYLKTIALYKTHFDFLMQNFSGEK